MPEIVHAAMALPSDPLRFREARRWAFQVALQAGLDRAEANAVAVALAESCANVHRHAYSGRRDGPIELAIDASEGRVVTTVRHRGVPFDTGAYVPPDLGHPAEGGYGMYLIAKLVDDVSFVAGPEGGTIVLVKRRRAEVNAALEEWGTR